MGDKIVIDHNCTVDLSRAGDPEGSFYYLFQIKGDNVAVTFTTSNREEPLNLGSSLLFTVDKSSKNPTVILDAVNITCSSNPANYTFSYPYEGPEPSVLIIQYNGECRVPTFCFSARKNVTTRFQPDPTNAAGSVLNIEATYLDYGIVATQTTSYSTNVELIGGKIVTDGSVRVPPSNSYKEDFDGSLRIENCNLTCKDIRARELTIDGSEVSTTQKTDTVGIIGGASYGANKTVGFLKIINGSTIDCAKYIAGSASGNTLASSKTNTLEIIDSTVTCRGVLNAADITIQGSTVNATDHGNNTAAIGGYFNTLSIIDSTINADASNYGSSGIGAGRFESYKSNNGTDKYSITIENSKVTATSAQGNAIGSTYNYSNNSKDPKELTITINGGEVTATAVNAPAIGAVSAIGNTDPDMVIIHPGAGGGWENGGTPGEDISTQGLLSLGAVPHNTAAVSSHPDAPESLEGKQTHWGTATLILEGNPKLVAESGVIAINAKTVTTNSNTLIQNTLQAAPVQNTALRVGDTVVGTMRRGFRSLAVTANNVQGNLGMTYGAGSDPDPLVNWHEDAGPLYGDLFAVKDGDFNSFWTVPQQKLGGSATVSLDSADGSPVSTAETNKTLYANIQQVTPSGAGTMVSYQWYKDGQLIVENATQSEYQPAESGLYHYVLTGNSLYRGQLTSASVTVVEAGDTAPDAPVRESVTKDTIVLAAPTDGKTYEYSINGGSTWQDDLTFTGLTPNTTYNIVRREKVGEDGNPGPVSKPLTEKTLGDRPDESVILNAIDYENECFAVSELPNEVSIYTDQKCTKKLNEPTNGGSLEDYIADPGEQKKFCTPSLRMKTTSARIP